MPSRAVKGNEFYDIWLQLSSWLPIQLVAKSSEPSWITLKNPKGKAIPFGLNHLQSAYEGPTGDAIGKRFGRLTNYLMVDIDSTSIHHPLNNAPDAVLEALENLGLCEPIIIRSSCSGGLHIYFPLHEPMPSWQVAKFAHYALTQAGIEIIGGQCELFPNKKAYTSGKITEYNGHRLPLQYGSYLLDDDFQPISNSQELFVKHWKFAASRNMLHDYQTVENVGQHIQKPKPILKSQAVSKRNSKQSIQRPLPEFTGPGETNEILKELVNYGDKYLKLRTIPELSQWMQETVVNLPGYDEFCSEDSKANIARDWCKRWAKSHLIKRQHYVEADAGPEHNATVAKNALERFKACLEDLGDLTFTSRRKLWQGLRKLGLERFGTGVGWRTFEKLENLWKHLVECSGLARLGATPTTPEDHAEDADKTAHTVNNARGVCTLDQKEFQPAHTPPQTTSASKVLQGIVQGYDPDQNFDPVAKSSAETAQDIKPGVLVEVLDSRSALYGQKRQIRDVREVESGTIYIWLEGVVDAIHIQSVRVVDASTAYGPPPAWLSQKMAELRARLTKSKFQRQLGGAVCS